jgi:hypothetical protein
MYIAFYCSSIQLFDLLLLAKTKSVNKLRTNEIVSKVEKIINGTLPSSEILNTISNSNSKDQQTNQIDQIDQPIANQKHITMNVSKIPDKQVTKPEVQPKEVSLLAKALSKNISQIPNEIDLQQTKIVSGKKNENSKIEEKSKKEDNKERKKDKKKKKKSKEKELLKSTPKKSGMNKINTLSLIIFIIID